ncbi:MAG: hypothetical protein ACI9ZF_000562 [Bradyrhizobium sp.]|jgi:hypothetical protein
MNIPEKTVIDTRPAGTLTAATGVMKSELVHSIDFLFPKSKLR